MGQVPATWLEQVWSRSDSNEPAIIDADGTWTGRELFRRAAGAADFLDEVHAPPGVPVVVLVSSSRSAFALTLGGAVTNRPLAPLGPRLTVAELAPSVEAIGGPLIIAEAGSEELGSELAARTGRTLVLLPEVEASNRDLPSVMSPEKPVAILHTSGTTGVPKPVSYRQGPLAARVRVNAELVGLGPGSVYATASPFHHIAGLGMLFVALGSGAALWPMPRFDLGMWAALRRGGVTHALAVPSMIEMLLEAGELAFPGLQVLQYGASPIRPETLRRAMNELPGVRFVNIFGQTEGSPITCLTFADHDRAASGDNKLLASVGRPAPGVNLEIHDPDDHGIGEVYARADHFFAPGAHGWLHTGDLGRLDEEGYLFLSGRKGDKIIRGGENVYPAEVEAVLVSHRAVCEACVYGLPDDRLGEEIAATVVPAAGVSLPPWDEIQSFMRGQLAGFKVPRQWQERRELPRNPTGKVLRRALVTEHAGALTGRHESS